MRRFFLAGLSAALMVAVLFAQGPVGTLNGTITDPAGAVVPGATVIATNNATGVETKTTSTSSGTYTLPYLPGGTYTIRVNAPGFETSTAENVILRVAQSLVMRPQTVGLGRGFGDASRSACRNGGRSGIPIGGG